jgi:hypothetical protein
MRNMKAAWPKQHREQAAVAAAAAARCILYKPSLILSLLLFAALHFKHLI